MTKPLASGVIARTTSYMIDPKRVMIKAGWNNRFDMGDIASLADSVRTELTRDPSTGGLINAIHVKRIARDYGHDFEVVMGHRRITAIKHLLEQGVEFPNGIPAVIVDKSSDEMDLVVKLVTENMQKPLLPLEEAHGYKRLLDGGMVPSDIAKAVGRTEVHVRETLSILDASVELQDALKSGAIGATAAKIIATVAKGDDAGQSQLVAAAAAAKGAGKAAKAAKAALQAQIQARRDAKAAAAGRTVKMRALTDEQLSDIGSKLTKHLVALLKEAKLDASMTQEQMQAWAKNDEQLAAAYVAGAVDALKVAAGLRIDLAI